MSKIQITDLSSKSILKDLDDKDTRHVFGGEAPSSCWGGECRDRQPAPEPPSCGPGVYDPFGCP